jgi:hypothetical protein
MYSGFALIGPESDPAGAKGKDIVTALQTIKAKPTPFISRGDRSGMNMAEIELWKDAGIDIAKALSKLIASCTKVLVGSEMVQHKPVARIEVLYRDEWPRSAKKCHYWILSQQHGRH